MSNSFENNSVLSKLKGLMSNWKILLSVVGVITIILFIYLYMNKRNVVYENFQDASKPTNESVEIMLFSVDWCPHCKTAKPEWDQVKTEFQGKTVNGKKVLFTEINCTNETPETEKLMNTYQIKGYPTIKLVKEGEVVDFDAKPTKSTLTQFLNTAV